MKESVAISSYTARAVHDRLAQTGAWVDGRQFRKLEAVRIHVRGRVEFQHVSAGRFHGHSSLRSRHGQRSLQLHGHTASDRQVFGEGTEAWSRDFHVVWIGRNIRQSEGTVRSRSRSLAIAGKHIVNGDRGFRNGGPRGIHHGSFDSAGISKRLGEG